MAVNASSSLTGSHLGCSKTPQERHFNIGSITVQALHSPSNSSVSHLSSGNEAVPLNFRRPVIRQSRASSSSTDSDSFSPSVLPVPNPTPASAALPTIDLSSFKGVPVEEIAAVVEGDAVAHNTVQQIGEACTSVGFFYLVNHGVSQELVDSVRDVTRCFFFLPEEEKQKIALELSPHFRGYQRVGQNVTKGHPDWHEALDLYREFSLDHPLALAGRPLHGPNQWPEMPADFKPTILTYVDRMKDLGRLVMRLISLALQLPPDTFERDRVDDSFWVLRAIGYPPLPPEASSEGSLSCGEHTDYGLLTFVNQDPDVTALQVRHRDGSWVDAPPVPGAFVVNIGDMLTVWTNGIYNSTLHRVVNRNPTYRVSVPFFYEPNFDALVAPLPECVERSNPQKARYKPVRYGDHLQSKVTTNFKY